MDGLEERSPPAEAILGFYELETESQGSAEHRVYAPSPTTPTMSMVTNIFWIATEMNGPDAKGRSKVLSCHTQSVCKAAGTNCTPSSRGNGKLPGGDKERKELWEGWGAEHDSLAFLPLLLAQELHLTKTRQLKKKKRVGEKK